MLTETSHHSLLYLFLYDIFHQMLFYFGGVVAMLIFLWEKFTDKTIQWRWIGAFFLFCLFVSCFQGWIDEHHNSETLTEQKAQITSDKNQLQTKFDAKQIEVDYLRDHQQILVTEGDKVDPRVAQILDRLNRENQSLRNEPGKALKKSAIGLTKEMLEFFQKEKANTDRISNESRPSSFSSDPKERQAQWQQETQKLTTAWSQMDADIQAAMMTDYCPRAVALLEQIRERGNLLTGIDNKEIDDAINRCSAAHGGSSYWGIQMCSERLAVIAQKMH
jgi:hypothetical protein